jgi:CheY-like chemotaxis protein
LPNRRSRKRQVLLVEDEVFLRELLAEVLREDGFHVVEVGTGDEAIQILDERAVCTDVRMPGKADGIDVAVEARGRSPKIPVLMVSGYAQELGSRLDVLTPPAAFLPKPCRLDQVSEALRELLLT